MINYYEVLGLNKTATNDEIRRAYRVLARRYHPDVNPRINSEDKFRIISDAYQILSDNNKRKNYDEQILKTFKKEGLFQAKDTFSNAEFLYKNLKQTTTKNFNSPIKYVSLIKKLFSQKSNNLSLFKTFREFEFSKVKKFLSKSILLSFNKQPDLPQAIEVSLTVEEAIEGAKKTIELKIGNKKFKNQKLKLAVKIPSGVKNGSIVRFNPTLSSNKDKIIGTYFLIIKLLPHPTISIQSKGVVIETKIDLTTAIDGGYIEVDGLYGERLTVKVPTNTQSGDDVRIIGKGIKNNASNNISENNREDLFVRFLICVQKDTWNAEFYSASSRATK